MDEDIRKGAIVYIDMTREGESVDSVRTILRAYGKQRNIPSDRDAHVCTFVNGSWQFPENAVDNLADKARDKGKFLGGLPAFMTGHKNELGHTFEKNLNDYLLR